IMPRAWESSILRVHDDAMDPFYSNYRIGQLILKRSALRHRRVFSCLQKGSGYLFQFFDV
ncbi:hypothetical protein, partial [Serratia marcescens]|uniref:hypothetical protein n=1 Tax=Serratia marcescens TaxID=615 RepID=UPI003204ED39